MSSQVPTGYENYPRPDEPGRLPQTDGWQDPPPPAPIVRSYGGSSSYTPVPRSTTRRTLIAGGAALVGVVVVAGMVRWGSSSSAWPSSTGSVGDGPGIDPFDPSSDEEVNTDVLSLGGADLDVPAGWTVMADSDVRALLTKGSNQILVVSFEAMSSDPTDELSSAIDQSDAAFKGSLSKAKTTQGTRYGRAVVTGRGTFDGRSARQSAEVLISNDDSSALFIQQILSAAEDSATAKESGRLAADLRDSWPW